MTSNKWVILVGLLVAGLLVGCAGGPAATPAPTSAPAPAPAPAPASPAKPAPKGIQAAVTGGTTSSGFVCTAATIEVLKKYGGLEMKVTAVDTPPGTMTGLKDGTYQFATAGHSSLLEAFNATGVFAKEGWKPMTDLRQIWTFAKTRLGCFTRADSGIKTMADLKGKSLAYAPASGASELCTKGIVAFAGLNWDDVKKLNAPDYNAATTYVKDGKADYCFGDCGAAAARELEASPHGMFIVPMPPENTEGWKRFAAANPGYMPVLIEKGWGAGAPDSGVWGCGAPYVWVSLTSLSPDLVYSLCRGWTLGYEEYKNTSKILDGASLRYNADPTNISPSIPLHEGTVRWLKEMGCWTIALAEHEGKLLKAIGANK